MRLCECVLSILYVTQMCGWATHEATLTPRDT